MIIRAGYSIAFTCTAPTALLLLVHIRPERQSDLTTPDLLNVNPFVPVRTYYDRFGNLCTRLVMPPGRTDFSADFHIYDSGVAEQLPYGMRQHPVEELPDDVLMYLLGSRYCDTQRLMAIAWDLFGQYPLGWPRLEAILNFTHERIQFGYGFARNDRTASEAYEERVGVCRDYAHLAVTFCRCMNIPARYCTGYLGDIGVPRDPNPMDFSAWFEVYMEGGWHTVDARHNHPRIGRILMARGMDATDTAISVTFGNATLVDFQVITEEMGDQRPFQSPYNAASTA
jgi:transglutaminase-like putative cysteine protease